MSRAVSKWSPIAMKCGWCWAFLHWEVKDVVFKGNRFYVDCPECKAEIDLDASELPPKVRDEAKNRAGVQKRFA